MRFFEILVLMAVFLSCKSSIPKDVLSPKKMQAVLWDVMQADELAEYYSTKDSSFKNLGKHADYYEKIFSLHKITKEDFTKSLSYYENHPTALKPILDSLQSFGERLQRADSLRHPNHPVDTVRKPSFMNQHS
jgi:Domain of unknown function (DUF4296)